MKTKRWASSQEMATSSTGGGADGRSDWAGNFDCSECGRKRLTAQDFSKAQAEKFRKDEKFKMTCKNCVSAKQEKERADAAARVADAGPKGTLAAGDDAEHVCSSCNVPRPASAYTRNQILKGPTKQRCSECVAKAEAAATAASGAGGEAHQEKLKEARAAAAKAEASGSAAEKLKASSQVAALEAELVTGLKPIKLGSTRGRGRGGGSWRGRGR